MMDRICRFKSPQLVRGLCVFALALTLVVPELLGSPPASASSHKASTGLTAPSLSRSANPARGAQPSRYSVSQHAVSQHGAGRIALKVLVLSDASASVNAYEKRLEDQGIPYHKIDLRDAGRQPITAEALRGQDARGEYARFQGIIAPTSEPTQLSVAERRALDAFQEDYGVRRFDVYVWPNRAVGLAQPTFSGVVDGMSARLSEHALAADFGYLRGDLTFDDADPEQPESYGFLAGETDESESGSENAEILTPILSVQSVQGVSGAQPHIVMAVHEQNRRERLFSTISANYDSLHFGELAPGVLNWLTRGVNLGMYRSYLSVESDDVFLADNLWNVQGKCTFNYDCQGGEQTQAPGTQRVRMKPQDVDYLRDWQRRYQFKIDQVFNGIGIKAFGGPHRDQLFKAFMKDKDEFRWINHTWDHPYLGCRKTASGPLWQCERAADGEISWPPVQFSTEAIARNIEFAERFHLPINPTELVTGEHSGLASLPEVAQDNPHLLTSLDLLGVQWVGSDASREKEQRSAGFAQTVPRYPSNIFYNVATREQETALYNWIYTSRADGGSGSCEDHADISTCITPLDLSTGWSTYICPHESRQFQRLMRTNDPRPIYTHQSNFAMERIGYEPFQDAIERYRQIFADNSPIINPTLAQAGTQLERQRVYRTRQGAVQGMWEGEQVTLNNTDPESGLEVPLSVPSGSAMVEAGDTSPETGLQAYGVGVSGWLTLPPAGSVSIQLAPASNLPTSTAEGRNK